MQTSKTILYGGPNLGEMELWYSRWCNLSKFHTNIKMKIESIKKKVFINTWESISILGPLS